MKNRSTAPMRVAKAGSIVMSLLFCAAGAACIARPGLPTAAIGRAVGWAMILFGAVKLVGYCSRDLYRLAFQYDLGFGLLLIALGALVLARPGGTADFFAGTLGAATLTDGLYKLQIALDARRFGLSSWWLTLALALITGLAGLALAFRPWAQPLTALLGMSLLAVGALNLCVAVSMVKIVNYQRPDPAGDAPPEARKH